jgi:hypothetical protein
MRPTRSSVDGSVGKPARLAAAAAAIVVLGSLAASCSSDKLEPVPTAPETLAPVGGTETTRFIEVTTTAPGAAGATTVAGATTPATSNPVASNPVVSNPGAELPPLTGFGIGDTMFDDDADTAIQGLTAVFGTPSTDTGWVAASASPFGTCPGQHVRAVRWGQLQTVYSDEGGAEHFLNYTYGLANREAGPELRTDVGVGLGSTTAQVQTAYPDAEIGSDAARGAYFVDEAAGLSGSFDQAGAAGKVTRIVGGTPCQ